MLERDDIVFVTARLKRHLRERFDSAGLSEKIGPEHFYATVREAVNDWSEKDPDSGGDGEHGSES